MEGSIKTKGWFSKWFLTISKSFRLSFMNRHRQPNYTGLLSDLICSIFNCFCCAMDNELYWIVWNFDFHFLLKNFIQEPFKKTIHDICLNEIFIYILIWIWIIKTCSASTLWPSWHFYENENKCSMEIFTENMLYAFFFMGIAGWDKIFHFMGT